jgi:hypothetical protein
MLLIKVGILLLLVSLIKWLASWLFFIALVLIVVVVGIGSNLVGKLNQ